MQLHRAEDGRWSIQGLAAKEMQAKRVWADALPRYLDILDELFDRAQTTREFDFIHSLIPVRGVQDAGWDAWETTQDAMRALVPLINESTEWATRRHLKLWTWGHVIEAAEPYELLRNLLEVAVGGRFHVEWFPDAAGGRPQHPLDKINQIDAAAKRAGLADVGVPLREIWDRDLRNAVFHADYALYGGEVNLPKVGRSLGHEAVELLVGRADAYLGAIVTLRDVYIGDYNEPKLISARGFSADPDGKAWVIVRKGHGAVGLKHALSASEIAVGGIPWRLGVFTREELELLDADPTLAQLPARKEAGAPELG